MFGRSLRLTKLLANSLRIRWVRWTFGGVVLGIVVGLRIGGAGLAVGGTAFPINTSLVLSIIFGAIGYLIGITKKPIRVEPKQLKG